MTALSYHNTTWAELPGSILFGWDESPTLKGRVLSFTRSAAGVVCLGNTLFPRIKAANELRSATVGQSIPSYPAEQQLSLNRNDHAMLERVRSLVALYRSRDDGRPLASNALNDAELFILALPETMRSLPSISLADDGEINFFWNDGHGRIDLGMYGNGYYSFYVKSIDGREEFGDDLPIDSVPSNLTSILKAS